LQIVKKARLVKREVESTESAPKPDGEAKESAAKTDGELKQSAPKTEGEHLPFCLATGIIDCSLALCSFLPVCVLFRIFSL
jgi:hypothetical protein